MKKTKQTFLMLALGLLSLPALHAQTKFEVPQNATFDNATDYPKYNNDIVNAAKWLEETDLDKEDAKRRQVGLFVTNWVSGSPDIIINIMPKLMDCVGKNSTLLIIYMASYARYSIEHKNNFSDESADAAGFASIIKVYKRGINIVPNANMDKMIAAIDKKK